MVFQGLKCSTIVILALEITSRLYSEIKGKKWDVEVIKIAFFKGLSHHRAVTHRLQLFQ